jgi:outer membrane protein assembly factor BamB
MHRITVTRALLHLCEPVWFGSLLRLAVISIALVVSGCDRKAAPTQPQNSVTVLWRRSYDSAGIGRAFALGSAGPEGRVVVSDAQRRVHALDLVTGERRWIASTTSVGERLIDDGERIYLAGGTSATALSARSGTMLWSASVGGGTGGCSASVRTGVMYVCTDQWYTIALDAATGRALWSTNHLPRLYGQPTMTAATVVGDTVYSTFMTDYSSEDRRSAALLFALDARTGAELWRLQVGDFTRFTRFTSPPIVSDTLLIFADALDNRVVAINRFRSAVAWTYAGLSGWAGGRIARELRDGTVFFASGDQHLYAIDAATGRLRWRAGPLDGSQSGAAVCGPYVFAWNGLLTVIERQSGRVRGYLHDIVGGLADDYADGVPFSTGEDVIVQNNRVVTRISCRP